MPPLTTTHDAPVTEALDNDPFYGDIEFQEFQEAYRLPATVAPETFVRQLRLALDEVNQELTEWMAARVKEGQIALTEEERRYYEEAVYSWAYALLIPMLPSLHATDQADGLEDDMAGNEARFRARSEGYLKRITGQAEPGEFSMRVI